MQIPLQITFRHMEKSDALESKIREKAEKLEQFANRITSCRVVVEQNHKHKHKGNIFHIRVDITLPGEEIVVSREPDARHAHEDAYVVVRDAFSAARRQVEDYVRRQRGEVKTKEMPPTGYVKTLIPMEDYGTIETLDGREIYFHRNSVIELDFEKLVVGDKVRFHETQGDNGPQASTVHIVKHNGEV